MIFLFYSLSDEGFILHILDYRDLDTIPYIRYHGRSRHPLRRSFHHCSSPILENIEISCPLCMGRRGHYTGARQVENFIRYCKEHYQGRTVKYRCAGCGHESRDQSKYPRKLVNQHATTCEDLAAIVLPPPSGVADQQQRQNIRRNLRTKPEAAPLEEVEPAPVVDNLRLQQVQQQP